MVRVEVTCDKCGAIITADRSKLVAESGPLRAQRGGSESEPTLDLCRECAEALLAWLSRRVGGDA
jgi:hypothetical protein